MLGPQLQTPPSPCFTPSCSFITVSRLSSGLTPQLPGLPAQGTKDAWGPGDPPGCSHPVLWRHPLSKESTHVLHP